MYTKERFKPDAIENGKQILKVYQYKRSRSQKFFLVSKIIIILNDKPKLIYFDKLQQKSIMK